MDGRVAYVHAAAQDGGDSPHIFNVVDAVAEGHNVIAVCASIEAPAGRRVCCLVDAAGTDVAAGHRLQIFEPWYAPFSYLFLAIFLVLTYYILIGNWFGCHRKQIH